MAVKEKVQKVEGQSRGSGSPHRITKSRGKSSGSYEGDPTPLDHYFWLKSTAYTFEAKQEIFRFLKCK